GSVVEGNLFCTNKTGSVAIGTGSSGMSMDDGSNVTVGGLTAAAANEFACKAGGVSVTRMTDVRIQGNRFGIDPTGTKTLLGGVGLAIDLEFGGDGIVVGGTAAGAANVIGGYLIGIHSQETTGAIIQGNFIGTDATATKAFGNAGFGIRLAIGTDVLIGGTGS